MAEQLQASRKPDNLLRALRHYLKTTDGSKPARLASARRIGKQNRVNTQRS